MDYASNNPPESPGADGEISVHAETYHRFMLGVKWMAIHLAVILVFLVLWFCTSAGFFAALIGALLVLAAGVFIMRQPPPHLAILGTLQPMLISTASGRLCAMMAAASRIKSGSAPKICTATGRSSSRK